jgi:hypothetical protein
MIKTKIIKLIILPYLSILFASSFLPSKLILLVAIAVPKAKDTIIVDSKTNLSILAKYENNAS